MNLKLGVGIVLAVVAAAPFIACAARREEPVTAEVPPAGSANATATASATVSGAATATVSATVSGAATATVSATASVSASGAAFGAAEPPPPKFAGQGALCPAIERVSTFIDQNRSCKTDADCAVVYTGCGMPGTCGVGVRAAATKELASRALAAHNDCAARNVPLPCATCPALPPARCGNGWCRP